MRGKRALCRLLCAAAVLAAAGGAYAESPILLSPEQAVAPVALRADSIPFNLENRGRDHSGKLTYLGGLELKSGDRRFGGLSSLQISADGSQMLAVSDRGYWVGATLVYRGDRLAGAHNLVIAPLLDLTGRPLHDDREITADAEALAEIPGSGFVVSFEGQHRLWHYGAGFSDFMTRKPARPLPLPVDIADAIAALPGNGGIEAMTGLPDGSLIAIAEDNNRRDDKLTGWIIGETQIAQFTYLASDNFRPTDLAALPNGDLLVLERRLTLLQGLAARVRRIAAADLKAGAPVTATAVATLSFPDNIDNMEGIATRTGPDGTSYVYLLSDDNYHPLQRTLLMMFRLAP